MLEENSDLIKLTRRYEDHGTVWRIVSAKHNLKERVDGEINVILEKLRQNTEFDNAVSIYQMVSGHMAHILRGAISPLPLLFPLETEENYKQNLTAEAYYSNYPGNQVISSKLGIIMQGLITQLGKQNNGARKNTLRILELGAGTGSLTATAIRTFSTYWGHEYEYYFTDISASFFSKAAMKFSDIASGTLKYVTFNIEHPPLEQGIPVNYFDMVLASNVLHATKNLRESLRNVRQTMRAQAVLLFAETFSSIVDRGITFLFGLLEGYWRFEDFDVRKNHCCVDGPIWKQLLLESGFEDVKLSNLYCDVIGGVTALATTQYGWSIPGTELQEKHRETKTWLLFFPEEGKMSYNLQRALTNSGINVKILLPEPKFKLSDDKVKTWIEELLLDDGIVNGIIYAFGKIKCTTLQQTDFGLPFLYIAKRLLTLENPPSLIVLTQGVQSVTENQVYFNPSAATLIGMLKSMKNEKPDLLVSSIDLDGDSEIETVDLILNEIKMHKNLRDRDNTRVAYRGGTRYEPKFCRSTLSQNANKLDLPLPPFSKRYELLLPKTKANKDLSWVSAEPKPIGKNEVEVQAKTYALNFRDIFTILKPIPQFDNYNNLGVDFAGIITQVGADISPQIMKAGDHVLGIKFCGNPMPSHVVVDINMVSKIPQCMTFNEAACFPAVLSTVIHCFKNVGKLKKDDWVLIHTASGGVGLVAIQLVRLTGAKLITTAGTARKRAYLKSLGIEHVFPSRDTSFQKNIMQVTEGRGVDIVLNTITGPGLKEATLASCGKKARFIELSRINIWSVEEVKKLRPDVQYTIEDLSTFSPEERRKLVGGFKEFIEKAQYKPIPYVLYDALRVRQALSFLQQGKHIGKVLVTMPEQKVLNERWILNISLFNSESLYIITGGLAGIGFAICKWMLKRGATDILLVGRRAPEPKIKKEIDCLNKKGNNILYRLADVGDFSQCQYLIEDAMTSCKKPIKGIQHCAGVIRDNLYGNLKWEDMEHTFQAKVYGTWNLHILTREMFLEHFVLHSSFTSLMGTPGQANHVSACCFEDSMVHYRNSIGLPATGINWGQWAQVGIARDMNVSGFLPVSYKRMLNGLEEALRSQCRQVAIGTVDSFQFVVAAWPALKFYIDEKILTDHLASSQDQICGTQKSDPSQFWKEVDAAGSLEDKLKIATSYMKNILRGTLSMNRADEISNDVSLSDLGVDSLMVIELRNSIQSLCGSRQNVTSSMIKDCNNVTDLSQMILNGMNKTDKAAEVECLDTEELLALIKQDIILEDGVRSEGCEKPRKINKIRNVLITGSTGQVGPYLMAALSRTVPKLENIFCLVRKKTTHATKEYLENILKSMNLSLQVDLDKVRVVSGNSAMPNFGLEPEEYSHLANSVDAIFHLAVKSNHLEAYKKQGENFSGNDVRSVNVGSLLNVLRFASSGKAKHVYYPSSWITAIIADPDDGHVYESWPNLNQIGKLVDSHMPAYVVSKWVCESLLQQANDRGIPCKVFRFAYLLGDSLTGQLNYRQNHYLLRLISYLKHKAMPNAQVPAFPLPVDVCVNTSVKVFLNDDIPNDIYNILHPLPQVETEFAKLAMLDYGLKIELVEWNNEAYLSQLSATGMPLESLRAAYGDIERISIFANFPGFILFKQLPDCSFQSKKLKHIFPKFLDVVPKPMEVIRKSLEYVNEQGFLDKWHIYEK